MLEILKDLKVLRKKIEKELDQVIYQKAKIFIGNL